MVIGFLDSANWICISSVAALLSRSILSDCLQPLELWPWRLLCAWNSPGKNTGASCYSPLQGSSRPRLQKSKIRWTQRLGWDHSKTLITNRAFLCGSVVKNLPAVQEILFRSLGQEDPLGKEMATHSSMLAWRIPWAKEPGRLQSMGSQKSQTQLSN